MFPKSKHVKYGCFVAEEALRIERKCPVLNEILKQVRLQQNIQNDLLFDKLQKCLLLQRVLISWLWLRQKTLETLLFLWNLSVSCLDGRNHIIFYNCNDTLISLCQLPQQLSHVGGPWHQKLLSVFQLRIEPKIRIFTPLIECFIEDLFELVQFECICNSLTLNELRHISNTNLNVSVDIVFESKQERSQQAIRSYLTVYH